MADIKGALGWLGLVEYLELWDMLAGVNLNNTDDIHRWKPEASGEFSTRSAYKNFFVGAITFEPWKKVWKSWAPGKCKTFVWLAIRNRCWTADRLQKRGLPHPERCPLCDQEEENIQHILTSCVFARQFWFAILQPLNLARLTPTRTVSFADWWKKLRGNFRNNTGRGLILCASSEPGPFGSIGMHVFSRERLQTYKSRCKPSRRNHTFGNSQGLRGSLP